MHLSCSVDNIFLFMMIETHAAMPMLMHRWCCLGSEEACTLTVEGEDVLEDVVLDVVEAAAGGGVVGVEERAAAERRLELGVVADELRPHPLHLLLGLGAPLRPRPEEAHQSMRRVRGRRSIRVADLLLLAAVHHHRLKRRHG